MQNIPTKTELNKVSFILLLIQEQDLTQELQKLNPSWYKSLEQHLTKQREYSSIQNIPFFVEGYDKTFEQIIHHIWFGNLKHIYRKIFPPIDWNVVEFPAFVYFTPFEFHIEMVGKEGLPKSLKNYSTITMIRYRKEDSTKFYFINYSKVGRGLEYKDKLLELKGLNKRRNEALENGVVLSRMGFDRDCVLVDNKGQIQVFKKGD